MISNLAKGETGELASRDKTKVFVSYSRADADFVRKLVAALSAQDNIQVFQDTADILPSEEWRKRLEGLIAAADTIVFCLSRNSAASEICAWEVSHAESLNKRIIPIVLEKVDGPVPGGLAKLNYIFFDDVAGFGTAHAQLVSALQTNIAWIREHSRIGELARRWERTARRKDLLLRGSELSEAEQWALYRPVNAPLLTVGMSAYIQASRDGERQSQKSARRVQTTIISLLLAVISGLVGFINQDYLREQYHWRLENWPTVLTAEQEREMAGKPGPDTIFTECVNHCPQMVVVTAGKFMMGSPEGVGEASEGPQHEVTIAKPFAVGRTEITFPQYGQCSPCRVAQIADPDGGGPAVDVSWNDAKQYVAWLSRTTGKDYRLLTEAEWEYAARAGNRGKWSFGDDEKQLGNYAWYSENSESKSHAVATKVANAFGLYDMHGNVFEWVEDCQQGSYKDAPLDGTAITNEYCSNRVIRGGYFDGNPDDLRSASRGGASNGGRGSGLGFRVGRTLER